MQDRDYNSLIADESGILHSDAEEDLKMIQQQLRTFNDVSIDERQSIIKNHLEGSGGRLDQSCTQKEGHLSKPVNHRDEKEL